MDTIGCTYDRRQVGLFLWGRIPEHLSDCKELTDKLLYEKNIFMAPGSIFGSAGDRYVRISLCCKNHQLEEALARITNY